MGIHYSIEDKYLKSIDLMDYGKMVRAKQLLEEILEEEPGHVLALAQLGRIYAWSLGELQQGRKLMEMACRINPQHYFPPMALGHVLKRLGDTAALEELIAHYADVPGVDKAELYELLASACENQGRFLPAIQYYELVLYFSNGDTAAEEALTRLRKKTSNRQVYRYELK